jgi:MFS family permease
MPKRDYAGLIVWSTVGVMVTRYSGAFVAADVGQVSGWLSSALTIGAVFTGVGMGVLDVVGTAYIADAWRRMMPRSDRKWSNRYKVLTVFLLLNAIEAVFILTPYTMSRIHQTGITGILDWGWSLAWSIVVNIAPLIVVGGVIFANPNVIGIKVNDETPVETPVKTIETVAVVPKTVTETPGTSKNGHKKGFECPVCFKSFDTWNGLSGHKKVHRKEVETNADV